MRRIMLFISSYIPLYILLIIKNILERCTQKGRFTFSIKQLKTAHYFDEINDYAIVTLLLLCAISFLYLIVSAKKDSGIHYYEIISIEDQTGNVYFNYISIYLLSCLGLTLNNIVDVFILVFLMIIVGYIYITNHMTYINPVLQFMGYKIFEGELKSKSTGNKIQSIIIVKKGLAIKAGTTCIGSGKEDFVFITQKDESTDNDSSH